MLTALIARPPVCGATLGSLQARVALAIDGVVKVKPVTAGVAVIARDFWTAKKGRDALVIEWQEGANANLSTDELREHYRALSAEPGQVAEKGRRCRIRARRRRSNPGGVVRGSVSRSRAHGTAQLHRGGACG